MRQQLSVALVGYGLAGRVFHAALIEATDDLRLVSVVTASPERAAQVRADHPHADVVTDVAHLLHDADEYDLLVVATANAAHERIARAGLRRGLHVLVDKPLARDVHPARALAEVAGEAGDDVSNDLGIQRQQVHEKNAWMLRSHLD